MATFKKNHPKLGGRKKGTPNKNTLAVKESILAAAEGLGGTARLIEWAQSDPLNERVFWGTMYPKLLPLTVDGDANNPIRVEVIEGTLRFVSPT